MIDVASQCEETLVTIRDVGLNLLWRHARVEDSDDDHGNLDQWEQIDGHAHDGRDADHHDDHARHENEEGVFDGKGGHGYLPPFWFALWNSVNLLEASCGVTFPPGATWKVRR